MPTLLVRRIPLGKSVWYKGVVLLYISYWVQHFRLIIWNGNLRSFLPQPPKDLHRWCFTFRVQSPSQHYSNVIHHIIDNACCSISSHNSSCCNFIINKHRHSFAMPDRYIPLPHRHFRKVQITRRYFSRMCHKFSLLHSLLTQRCRSPLKHQATFKYFFTDQEQIHRIIHSKKIFSRWLVVAKNQSKISFHCEFCFNDNICCFLQTRLIIWIIEVKSREKQISLWKLVEIVKKTQISAWKTTSQRISWIFATETTNYLHN